MTPRPADAFRGALIVAGRDLRSNARGAKVWAISGLTLLAILVAAFGIGGLTTQAPPLSAQYVLWPSPYWPANNTTAGIVVWMSDYQGTPRSGLPVLLGVPYGQGVTNATFVERAQVDTNATGWAVFPNLGPGAWPLRFTVGALTIDTGVYIPAERPLQNLTVGMNRFDLLGDGARRDVGFQAMSAAGRPIAGAVFSVNGDPKAGGVSRANGFFTERFNDGTWNVTAAYGGESVSETIVVVRSPYALLPVLQGPDQLLLFLGVSLMGVFAPIIAIAMSYDAIAKERMQGSLEILLSRPASRTGIAVGKFLGSFASVALPMLGVILGALLGVAAVSGQFPDAVFTTAFVLGTLGLIATYVLLMQIFSTLAKSPGNAILSAIVVWIVFNIAWDLVLLAAETTLHIKGGTPEAFTLSAVSSLFNPNGVFSLLVTTFVPSSALGLFGTTGGGSLPDWIGPVAMAVWIVVLLGIAVQVFRRRIV